MDIGVMFWIAVPRLNRDLFPKHVEYEFDVYINVYS